MSRRNAMTRQERRALTDALRSIARSGGRAADLTRMLALPRHLVGKATEGVRK